MQTTSQGPPRFKIKGPIETTNYLNVFVDGEKVSDYEMKLMDLDTEHLGIPVSLMCLGVSLSLRYHNYMISNST